MKLKKGKKWFLPKPFAIAAAASLVLAVLFLVLAMNVSRSLFDQQVAERWQSKEEEALSYSQISVFLARDTRFTYDSYQKLRYDIDAKNVDDGITSPSESAEARLWVDAASAEGSVSVSRGNTSVTVSATAVIGDYFLFHPLQMKSGQYINPNEASKDVVLLDWNAAWRLFGAYDVAGMQVEVGGRPCIVGGVFEKDELDTADNRIIMSYELYELINSSVELSALEFVLPNPVTGHAEKVVSDLVGVSEENCVIVENSSRFKLASLFDAVTNFGGTIAQSKSIALPYAENRARVAEFNGGVFLLLAMLFAILPVTGALTVLVKIYRRRGDIWSFVKSKLRKNERKSNALQEIDSSVSGAGDDAGIDDGVQRE